MMWGGFKTDLLKKGVPEPLIKQRPGSGSLLIRRIPWNQNGTVNQRKSIEIAHNTAVLVQVKSPWIYNKNDNFVACIRLFKLGDQLTCKLKLVIPEVEVGCCGLGEFSDRLVGPGREGLPVPAAVIAVAVQGSSLGLHLLLCGGDKHEAGAIGSSLNKFGWFFSSLAAWPERIDNCR